MVPDSRLASTSEDDDLQGTFWQIEDERRTNVPDVLYHYTRAGRLLDICRQNAVHATHVRFMSDAAEMYHGRDLLRDVVQSQLSDWTAEEAKTLEDSLLIFSQSQEGDLPPVFAVCFSERWDDAAQWDRYAEDGTGYAIGFAGSALGPHFRKKGGNWIDSAFLVPVIYEEDQQRRLLSQIVEKARRLAEPYRQSGTEKEFEDRCALIGHYAGWALMRLMARSKGEAFASEKEWRMIFTPGPAVTQSLSSVAGVKPTGAGIVPFVTLEYFVALQGGTSEADRLPIVQVVHGPRTRPESPEATRIVLNGHGYPHVLDYPLDKYPESLRRHWTAKPVWLRRSSIRLS